MTIEAVRAAASAVAAAAPLPAQAAAAPPQPAPQPSRPAHLEHLRAAADARAAAGLRRDVVARGSDDALLDLAGNDYLRLSRHPAVVAAGVQALREWGAGAGASRLVTGTTELHLALERDLARFVGAESALVLSSGYLANLAAITALSDSDTLIVSDASNHASIVDACRLSRARVVVTPHGDGSVEAAAQALRDRVEPRALVVTESLFSADGDAADLVALHEVSRAHGALLVVDDAHGVGVTARDGRGGVAAAGLAGEPDVVATVTLSKALGSQGGAVLGSSEIREHVAQSARAFVFDTGLAPASVASARAALGLVAAEPALVTGLRATAARLAGLVRAEGLATPEPAGAVVPVLLGEPARAVAAADAFRARGVRVGCFRPPSVPVGASRLRLTARPSFAPHEWQLIEECLRSLG